jgi:energy-coupling factor transporter ATP-binding protein EcfA2
LPHIEIEDLRVRYAGRKAPVLDGVDLMLNEGETVLLLGASGSGKSTLALTLNGLIPHSLGCEMGGSVRVAGMDTQETEVAELARRVGLVFQDPEAQFVTLEVEDEVVFGLENLCVPPQDMDGRVDRALARVRMGAFRHRRVDALSGGEKQRVALASLLAMEPRVLVFDEPTANLDPAGTREVFDLISDLKARGEHTIVLIEHKLDGLMHLVDRVVALGRAGELLADGPPREVFDARADTLREQGVWAPQISLLAHRLRDRGFAVDPLPVTPEEAERTLRRVPGSAVAGPDERCQQQPQTPGPPAVEVRGLSHAYGRDAVLDDVSLTVPRGDFLAVVGANGAGKTTLALHLAGVLRPPPGAVLVGGRDVARTPARELARRVGYVFQNPEHQFVTDSVADEVGYGLRGMGLPEAEVAERTAAMLERFGLRRYAKANPFTLSHGEKRRLSVATMLAAGQETLVLDEPTFGQDQRNAEEMMALLRDLNAGGRTVIIITHDMTLVAEHARHAAVLAGGTLLFHGPARETFARPDVLDRARLEPPPLARLARRLARHDPAWGGLLVAGDVASPGDHQPQGAERRADLLP